MTKMNRVQTLDFLREVSDLAAIPELIEVYEYCEKAVKEYNRPLRIAVTGMTNTGKSTLLNSLLQKYIVPTAQQVLTYNVNWFRHISHSERGKEEIKVYYREGNTEYFPLSFLETVVANNEVNKNLLERIRWVEVFLAHPVLEVFDLIDTPGLGSFMKNDSRNTKELLTESENRPDVIVYLMSDEFKQDDLNEVLSFHDSTGLMSGINAVAALAKCDKLEHKYETADRIIANNVANHAEVRFAFARIFTISALYSQMAYDMEEPDICLFRDFARLPTINAMLRKRERFIESADLDGILPVDKRKELLMKFELEGLRMAVGYFGDVPEGTLHTFRQYLLNYSRVELLKEYLIKRFGERTDFYKTLGILPQLKKFYFQLNGRVSPQANRELTKIKQLLNRFESNLQQEFEDFHILKDYYNRNCYFSEKEWTEALTVLGENGLSVCQRLQLPEKATPEEVDERKKEVFRHWMHRSEHYRLMGVHKAEEKARKLAYLIEHVN